MPPLSTEVLEQFVKKWRPSVSPLLESFEERLNKAGYAVLNFFDDYFVEEDPPRISWHMYTEIPNRPDDAEYLDMRVEMILMENDEDPGHLYPFLEFSNAEGSIYDDVKLSDPIRIDDDASWAKLFGDKEFIGDEIVSRIQAYSPTPTKRVWRILGTHPGNTAIHPSLHTNTEVARSEIEERFRGVLDRASRFFWDIEARGGSSGAPTGDLLDIRRLLDQGKPLQALKKYHDFLGYLEAGTLSRVNEAAGTIDVVMLGGAPWEESAID